MIKVTTFADCERDLIANGGRPCLDNWSATPSAKQLITSFVHKQFHQIPLAELDRIRQEHLEAPTDLKALGNVRKDEKIQEIEDLHPDHPIALLFHDYLEKTGRVPSFDQFREYVTTGPLQEQCWAFFRSKLKLGIAGYSPEQVRRAIRWRFGNAYMSSFREMYMAVWLREKVGLWTHYHLFADIQMQTDLWINNRIFCLRVPSDYLGRKPRAEDWARTFQIVAVDVAHQGFGSLWVPTDEQLAQSVQVCPPPGRELVIKAPRRS